MNRKELLEKFNANQAKTRSLVKDYKANPTDALKSEIRGMQDVLTIQKEELDRTKEKEDLMKKEGEKDVKRNKESKVTKLESRAMDSILRYDARSIGSDKAFADYKAEQAMTESKGGQDNGNGGLTIPENISNEIIDALEETSPVFEQAGRLTVGTGYAEILRELNIAQAGFVGELESLPQTSNRFAKIHMKASRVGAYMQLTSQLINDSAFDITSYATDFLVNGLSKALERAILVGEKTAEGFESVESQADSNHSIVLDPNNLSYGDLISFYTKLHPSFLADSMFIVSREMFGAIAKLADRKDGSGDYLLGKNMVGGVPGYRLFGTIPVYVSDALDGSNTDIIFGNFKQGYKVMVKDGMSVTHVTSDSAQALQGGHLIVLDAYMDGAVTNPEAFIISQRKSNAGATPKEQLAKVSNDVKSGNQNTAPTGK